MNKLEVDKRANDFYGQLDLSEATLRNYKNALNSTFMKDLMFKEYGKTSIFCILDLEILWNIYCKVNLHPKNIERHRFYSAAIMKYMRFLNDGKKYGRRIDYQKKKVKK